MKIDGKTKISRLPENQKITLKRRNKTNKKMNKNRVNNSGVIFCNLKAN